MRRPFAVTFAPEAAAEVTKIAAWWNENRLAAPLLFQQELTRSLLKIAAHPELGVRVHLRIGPNARAVLLPRSGYVVFYDVDPPVSKIQVLSRQAPAFAATKAALADQGSTAG